MGSATKKIGSVPNIVYHPPVPLKVISILFFLLSPATTNNNDPHPLLYSVTNYSTALITTPLDNTTGVRSPVEYDPRKPKTVIEKRLNGNWSSD